MQRNYKSNARLLVKNNILNQNQDNSKYEKRYFFNTKFTINKGRWTDISLPIVLSISYHLDDIVMSIEVLFWSNEKQKLVNINESFFKTDGTLILLKLILGDSNTHLKKMIHYLDKRIQNVQDLDLFMEEIEGLKVNFHQKYLNLFSEEILNKIYTYKDTAPKNEFWANTNILWFKTHIEHQEGDNTIFFAKFCEGMYLSGIEFDTDMDDTDLPTIEDINTGKTISPEEFLERLEIIT